jgi:hypothetical protein
MTLNEIRNMASKDLKIDETELDKYLIMFTDEKLIMEKLEGDLKIMYRDKWLYYTGKMSQEELDEKNWQPFDLNILKTDIEKFLYADEDMIKLSHRGTLQTEKVKYLEGVIKIINNRQWYIRSAIDWMKFTQGI